MLPAFPVFTPSLEVMLPQSLQGCIYSARIINDLPPQLSILLSSYVEKTFLWLFSTQTNHDLT